MSVTTIGTTTALQPYRPGQLGTEGPFWRADNPLVWFIAFILLMALLQITKKLEK